MAWNTTNFLNGMTCSGRNNFVLVMWNNSFNYILAHPDATASEYRYDGGGRRIESVEDNKITKFMYDSLISIPILVIIGIMVGILGVLTSSARGVGI